MSAPRVRPSEVLARALCERLQGGVASEALRATVASACIDWEHVVGYASAELVLPAFAAALEDLDLLGSLEQEASSPPSTPRTGSATASFVTSLRPWPWL